MHETSDDFFYSIITFSYTKYFVHSYTVDVVFTLSDRLFLHIMPLFDTQDKTTNFFIILEQLI